MQQKEEYKCKIRNLCTWKCTLLTKFFNCKIKENA